MNFKLKLALVAAAAALLAAPAFAAGEDIVLDNIATPAAVNDLAVAELASGGTLAFGANYAMIAQEGTDMTAWIDQTSTGINGNFASIAQASTLKDTATIVQVGDGLRASVFQRQ